MDRTGNRMYARMKLISGDYGTSSSFDRTGCLGIGQDRDHKTLFCCSGDSLCMDATWWPQYGLSRHESRRVLKRLL